MCSLLYSPQSGNTALNTNHSHGTRQVLDVTTCKPNDVLDGLLALTARENGVVVPHTKTRLQPPDNIGAERILLAGLIMSGTIPVPNAIKKLLHCETVRVQEPATQSESQETLVEARQPDIAVVAAPAAAAAAAVASTSVAPAATNYAVHDVVAVHYVRPPAWFQGTITSIGQYCPQVIPCVLSESVV